MAKHYDVSLYKSENMQRKYYVSLCKWMMIAFIINIIAACNTNNFSEPQPAAGKNLYEFPSMFIGKWADKNYNVVETDGRHITFIDILDIKVPLDSASFIVDNLRNKTTGAISKEVRLINYDTSGKATDTSLQYVIRDPYIYKVGADKLLQTGYKYRQLKDTIIIYKNERQGIDLGNNAFLRKVTDSLFVLNISNRILIKDNYFWQVLLVQKTAHDEINFYVPSDKMKCVKCMFYEYNDNLFYDCKWKPSDVVRLMKDGFFEKTSTLKRSSK